MPQWAIRNDVENSTRLIQHLSVVGFTPGDENQEMSAIKKSSLILRPARREGLSAFAHPRDKHPQQGLRARSFSVLNRPPPNYEGHVPLNKLEKGALAVGSAFGSLFNPYRGDLIASLGEATATPYFIYRLRDAMLRDPTGRRILRDRPRITSQNMSVEYLRTLPENSVGRAYVTWLDREGVTPDTRDQVKYIDDEECAYVMQRYRECHDFSHALTGLPVMVEGELALKAFEFANTVLPMTGLALAAVSRLKSAERERFWKTYLPWALANGLKSKEVINVYWEEQLETDVDELRHELGVEKPPDVREARKLLRDQKRAEKAAKDAQMRLGGIIKN